MRFFILILSILVTACATTNNIPEVIDYGCDDTVIRGRVVSVKYTSPDVSWEPCVSPTGEECFILWFGRYDLQVQVKEVFVGNESNGTIDAFYVAHSQIRDDRDFIFVLRPTGTGYEVKSGSLFDRRIRMRIAEQCSTEQTFGWPSN